MNITVKQLRRIIKEELDRIVTEDVSTQQANQTLKDFEKLIMSVTAMHPEKKDELIALKDTVFDTIKGSAGFSDVATDDFDKGKKLDKKNLPPDPRKKQQQNSQDRAGIAKRPNLESRNRRRK
jgi:hypothetical protein